MKWIIGEPSQENVYTYSYWNKIWNGSLVNPVKKMYIPIPTEKNMKWIISEPSQENVYTYSYWEKNMKWIIGEPSQENVYTYYYEMDHWWTQSRKMYIPIPTEKKMKWINGEPCQENVYTYSYWKRIWNGSLVNPVKKMYIPIPTEKEYEMDHWWTQSRKWYLFLLVNPVKKMYIPIPTEKNMKWIIGEPSQEKCIYLFLLKKIMKWINGEPNQENVYTYSYWKKIWNGSLVNPVKKMYIPIPTEIKYEMDYWWTQSRKYIYLFLLK